MKNYNEKTAQVYNVNTPSSDSSPPRPAGSSDSSSAAAPPSGTDKSPGETWR